MALAFRRVYERAMKDVSKSIRAALLGWYDHHRREFPWRAKPGQIPDPYLVWLSEIMLQQTGASTVAPYFRRFAARWPTVQALADADLEEVLVAWAGLGYYARARNLHQCARIVSSKMGGEFPRDYGALLKLPGIGPYTAAAIPAIAFNRPAAVLDGNIERVISRLYAVTSPIPGARPELRALSGRLIDCPRPGDVAQAMMDLGASICTPRAPGCLDCPCGSFCAARAKGMTETLPNKQKRPPLPARMGTIFWLTRGDGAVLLRRRPERGLLGGMMEFPGTPWLSSQSGLEQYAPSACEWRALPGEVRHVFTHFKLQLKVCAGYCGTAWPEGIWAQPEALNEYALPAVMQKAAAHVRKIQKELIL